MPANHLWRGDLPPVPQVTTITITADDAATTYKVTRNNKTVSVLGSGTGVANTAALLLTALQASSAPAELRSAISWQRSGATLIGTGPADGAPFTVTTSVSGGAGTIGAPSTTTSPSGPNWWIAGNFDSNVLPANTDNVYLRDSSVSIKYGLPQSGVTLGSLNIAKSYTGTIGLPLINGNGSNAYGEDNPRYLAISATVVNIGLGLGSGSRSIRLNLGTNLATINVYGMSSSSEAGQPSLLLQGSNAGNAINLYQGTVGLALEDLATGQIPTVNVGSAGQAASDVAFYTGPLASTITALVQNGGVVDLQSNVTSWTKAAGVSVNRGSATITTLDCAGPGTHYANSNGTIATARFRGRGAVLDCTQDDRPKTITSLTVTGGAAFLDPAKAVASLVYTTDADSAKVSNIGNAPYTVTRT